jgi:Na+/proline symporter
MTWWLAGTSIVATSFAADTPLVIAGWMRTIGLERNWFWWGGIMGMMLCTFFFARLWRRADILTDVEFNELRYSGKPAAGLRIFHATYRSLIQNTLVMCWVTLAMTKILEVTLNIPTLVFLKGDLVPTFVAKGVEIASVLDPETVALAVPAKITGIVLCLSVAAIYSTISGLWGVMATDFFQFCLAMTGTIVLMVIVFVAAGGPRDMVAKAEHAVNSGAVINRPRQTRAAAEFDKALAASGLITEDTGGKYQWTADGLTEAMVKARLADTNPDGEALTEWKAAYTVPRSAFTDFDAVDRITAAGILVEDRDSSGELLDYYRLSSVKWDSEKLSEQLDAAGVTNKADIMAAWHNDKVVPSFKITSFLPPFDLKGGGLLAVWSIVVFLGLQWWAGGEGGGFLAQRLFSCKNEKHSVMAMLWFNLANFVLRPWPWIVVGIASLFLIPDITAFGANYDAEYAYVIMLMKYLPTGLKGLMVASLMAAYMSTISTHVNFGASYVVNDLWKRFISKKGSAKSNVLVSQIASILLALLAGVASYFANNVGGLWLTMFELMSGAGFVVLLRWYWWRISAWSELSAMFSTLAFFCLLNFTHVFHALFNLVGAPVYLLDEYPVRFTLNLVCSTIVWVTVTFLTPPEKEENLVRFYQRIKPAGWWNHIAAKAGNPHHLTVGRLEWACWGLGVSGLFAMIASLGKACFGLYFQSLGYGIYAAVATWLIFRLIDKMDWSGMAATEEES